jgi:hypothetical protein
MRGLAMPTNADAHNLPEVLAAVSELGSGVFIGLVLAPGFLLCIPGITLAALVILAPLLALAIVVLAAAAVVMPFVLCSVLLKRWASHVALAKPIARSALSGLDALSGTVVGLRDGETQTDASGTPGLIVPLVK